MKSVGVVVIVVLVTVTSPLAARRLPSSFKIGEADSVLLELKEVPRPGPFSFQALPPIVSLPGGRFPSKYDMDQGFLGRTEFDANQYSIRAHTLMALRAMKESEKVPVRFSLRGPKVDLKGKHLIFREQQELGAAIFHLEGVHKKANQAANERFKEKSPRWQAHFDYVLASLQARLLFCYEYNYLLARIRTDKLPPLEPGYSGWRVGADKSLQISESKVKDLHLDMLQTFKRLQSDHPDTPWALQAAAEQQLERGLVWLPYRE
jgi:hypothetical protein